MNEIKHSLLALLVFALLLSCDSGQPGGQREKSASGILRVLAGSEIKDLEPYLEHVRKSTGYHLDFHYTGTLDGIERILSGENYDLAWFPNAKYLMLQEGSRGRILAQERIMLSPVIVGVKVSRARELGWLNNWEITWKDISEKAVSEDFRFAMTNPAASNSGFSAVVGLAAAISGKGDALREEEIDHQSLSAFYRGQKLTAGSSGWLAESFLREEDRLDGIVNYESVLMSLNASGALKEKLALVYPREGIITADYPLILLNGEKREAYDRVVASLRSPEFQRTIMEKTYRRPVNPAVPLDSLFSGPLLVEVPFPSSGSVIDAILLGYLNEQRLPSHSYFILDVSGSMAGDRLEQLKRAMRDLTGEDPSLSGRFAQFQQREKVTLVAFAEKIRLREHFDLKEDRPEQMGRMRSIISGLAAEGGTAIHGTLRDVYQRAVQDRAADPHRFYSIVLMTDGKNTVPPRYEEFESYYRQLGTAAEAIRVFPVFFGEAEREELEQIARLTGGKVFDGNKKSLRFVFKEIRGYQ